MEIIREFIGNIFSAARVFIHSVFIIGGVAAGLFLYQHHWNDLEGLPIVRGLTDTYKEGIGALKGLSAEAVQQFYKSGAMAGMEFDVFYNEKGNITGKDFLAGEPQAGRLLVRSTWHRDSVLLKLEKSGFSKGKLREAGKFLDYIENYREPALRDMYTSKVLASVKLAQGILESGAGASKLARNSNNHFGIKALPGRTARQKIKSRRYAQLRDDEFTYIAPAVGAFNYEDDHPYDRFEVYRSVADSYARHTQLLKRPCKMGNKGCYEWIWRTFPVMEHCDITEAARAYLPASGIAPEDFFNGNTRLPYYAAAAAGLKMAGYATSKKYHQKLAYLIDTYELWRFDVDLVRAVATRNR
jgi:flagellum-specific peptidoglycan hydrolase FlgJ